MTLSHPNVAILDIHTLQHMYGDESSENTLAVIKSFYGSAPHYVTTLKLALSKNLVSEITEVAHSFKSICALVGAKQMSELCDFFEQSYRLKAIQDGKKNVVLLNTCWARLELQILLLIQSDH